jgi:hypothetical protein
LVFEKYIVSPTCRDEFIGVSNVILVCMFLFYDDVPGVKN